MRRISARIWHAGMEGERREEGVDAAVTVAPNGLGGEDYVVVKGGGQEDGAVAAAVEVDGGGDQGDLADAGEAAGGSAAASEVPAKAATKVQGVRGILVFLWLTPC